ERPRSPSRVPAQNRRVVSRNGRVTAGRDRAPGGVRWRGGGRPRRRLDVLDNRPAVRAMETRTRAPVAVRDCGLLGNGGVRMPAVPATWRIGATAAAEGYLPVTAVRAL